MTWKIGCSYFYPNDKNSGVNFINIFWTIFLYKSAFCNFSLILCLSVSLTLCLSVSLLVCLSVSLLVCLSVSLLVCLSISLILCLSVSLLVCLSFSLSLTTLTQWETLAQTFRHKRLQCFLFVKICFIITAKWGK